MLASATAAQAATIEVTLQNDPAGAGDCTTTDQACSLRQAVAAASTGDTVALPAGTYTLTQGSDIDIRTSITISGAGVQTSSIDGLNNLDASHSNEPVRLLRVESGATVTLEHLTLTNGNDSADENCLQGCNTLSENGGASCSTTAVA